MAVSVGTGDGDGAGVCVGTSDGVGVSVGTGDGDGVCVGTGVAVSVGTGDGVGAGVGTGDGDGVAVGVAVSVGTGVGATESATDAGGVWASDSAGVVGVAVGVADEPPHDAAMVMITAASAIWIVLFMGGNRKSNWNRERQIPSPLVG